jgi:TET-associated glycosyltransferase-like protein
MMPNIVYIITRNRYANLRKIIPRWRDQDFKVVLVTEPIDEIDHKALIRFNDWGNEVSIGLLTERDRGVGYARNWAVKDAANRNFRAIIMSDDDVRPARYRSDMKLLIEAAQDDSVLGIGAARSIHNHFTQGAVSANHGAILCPGGWGFQLFALNITNTLRLGNFDTRLDCFGEDAELMRDGIAAGIPWLIHCDVWCETIGARYAPGGIMSYAPYDRLKREVECRRIIYNRWPEYTSKPEARPRMAWKRFYDDHIPHWMEMSAMHGGSLDNAAS